MRLGLRDLPVFTVMVALSVALGWGVLVDLTIAPVDGQWIAQSIVFLAVLLIPVVALWEFVSGNEPSALWAWLAPLVGAFLVVHYYAFDDYGTPPYPRNSHGDMPGWAIALGASVAGVTGALTWFRRRLGIVLTIPVCLGFAVLIFFSNVFH
jgi:hypothetical protein